MSVELMADSITLGYGPKIIIDKLNLDFSKNEIISIIGPNGSGKSTLLKALCRILETESGSVFLDNKNIMTMDTEEVAKMVSVMMQSAMPPPGITVEELVAYGRLPYRGFFDGLSEKDNEAIEEAIKFTELEPFRTRAVMTLSGGERQRVWLALALAQKPKILLLDEPTTFLDIHHQLELMELVVKLHKETGVKVIMVLHDLNHAARYSHRLIALKKGRVIADGSVEEVFCSDILETVYDVSVTVNKVRAGDGIYPVCFPYKVLDHS